MTTLQSQAVKSWEMPHIQIILYFFLVHCVKETLNPEI